jgi:hypothetical protein
MERLPGNDMNKGVTISDQYGETHSAGGIVTQVIKRNSLSRLPRKNQRLSFMERFRSAISIVTWLKFPSEIFNTRPQVTDQRANGRMEKDLELVVCYQERGVMEFCRQALARDE